MERRVANTVIILVAVMALLVTRSYLRASPNLATDLVYGSDAKRPDWMRDARTYPLLNASGRAIVDWVESRRQVAGDHEEDQQ